MAALSSYLWISSCFGASGTNERLPITARISSASGASSPPLLDLFEDRGVACTWATVGFLFCADKDELIASFPNVKPKYRERRLLPYYDLADLGRDEESDPYRYGLSLLKLIGARPRQEIATHTFSHFYCLENGGDTEAFRADLAAAQAAASRRGIALTSIVFPRNQVSPQHLRVCREAGLTAFRGNEACLVSCRAP